MVAKPTWKFKRLNWMSRRGWEALPVGLKCMEGPCRGPGKVGRPYRLA